ncbi:MAG: hypothetical protein RLZZ86_599, partial [Cyanobacteriota bacterium]
LYLFRTEDIRSRIQLKSEYINMITGAKMNTFSLYTNDFHAWTQEQVNVLKNQQWDRLDTVNLIEELETLGRKERPELRNRLALLLGHLLKWQFQTENRSSSWLSTIREQRIQIKLLLHGNLIFENHILSSANHPNFG